MLYELVSVTIKLQKYYLNMNPACSPCEWMAQKRGFMYYTHTKVRLTLSVFSLCFLNIGVHEHYLLNCSESHFVLEKLVSSHIQTET